MLSTLCSLLATLLGAVPQLGLLLGNHIILVYNTGCCLLGLLCVLVVLLLLVCYADDLNLSICEIQADIGPTAVPLGVTPLILLTASVAQHEPEAQSDGHVKHY